MNVQRLRAVYQRGHVAVYHEDAGVEIAGRGEALEVFLEDLPVTRAQRVFRVTARLQDITFSVKARIGHLRRPAAEPGIRRRVSQAIIDLRAGLVGRDAGIDGRAHVEFAPGRHRRRPVPAFDLADIEVDGMLQVFEMTMAMTLFVPPGFDAPQRLDRGVGGIDRVEAIGHFARMRGVPWTRTLNQSTPTLARTSMFSSGSGMITASA